MRQARDEKKMTSETEEQHRSESTYRNKKKKEREAVYGQTAPSFQNRKHLLHNGEARRVRKNTKLFGYRRWTVFDLSAHTEYRSLRFKDKLTSQINHDKLSVLTVAPPHQQAVMLGIICYDLRNEARIEKKPTI